MKYIKKFESFITESSPATAPDVKPATPSTSPGKSEPSPRPAAPSPIPGERKSPVPSPAKALSGGGDGNDVNRSKSKSNKATAEDVVERFVNLLEESGDDIKNYIK